RESTSDRTGGRRTTAPRGHRLSGSRASLGSPIVRRRRLPTQHDLLNAPGGDLCDEQLVRIPALDLVHSAELAPLLAALADLSNHPAVQVHLVDLARAVTVL